MDFSTRAARLLLAIGLVGLAAGVALSAGIALPDRPAAHLVSIDDTGLREVALVPLQGLELGLVVRNGSRVPVHIVGVSGGCSSQGCVEGIDLPLSIDAGNAGRVRLKFKAGKSGDFVKEFVVFTDIDGRNLVPLTITGRVADSG